MQAAPPSRFRAFFRRFFPGLALGAVLLGTGGGYAASKAFASSDANGKSSCCYPGSPCCTPGAPCCSGDHGKTN